MIARSRTPFGKNEKQKAPINSALKMFFVSANRAVTGAPTSTQLGAGQNERKKTLSEEPYLARGGRVVSEHPRLLPGNNTKRTPSVSQGMGNAYFATNCTKD